MPWQLHPRGLARLHWFYIMVKARLKTCADMVADFCRKLTVSMPKLSHSPRYQTHITLLIFFIFSGSHQGFVEHFVWLSPVISWQFLTIYPDSNRGGLLFDYAILLSPLCGLVTFPRFNWRSSFIKTAGDQSCRLLFRDDKIFGDLYFHGVVRSRQ